MQVKESYVKVTTIDLTQRATAIDDDFNVVGVINSPTGPYEETVVSSVPELIDRYLIGDSTSSTDDITVLHAAKLLQTMPLRLIRATSSKVLAGINNNGEVIYTDLNYLPFKASTTVTLSDITGVGCRPYLGIKYNTDEGESRKVLFKFTEDDEFKYSDEEKAAFTSFNADNTQELAPAAGVSKWGIESLLSQITKSSTYENIYQLSILNNNGSYVFYCGPDTSVELYPSWISSVTKSDISSDVTSVEFKNATVSGKVTANDYITINGYSFYEQLTSSSTNVVYPGVSVPIRVSAYTDFSEFGMLVLDKILSNPTTYATPAVIDSELTVELESTDNIRISGSVTNYYKFTPDITSSSVSEGSNTVKIESNQVDATVINSYQYLTVAIGANKYTFCACGLPGSGETDLGKAILVSSTAITPIKFLRDSMQILDKIRQGGYVYAGETLSSIASLNPIEFTIKNVRFTGLNSKFRSVSSYIAEDNNKNSIVVSTPVDGFSRVTFSSDANNFSNIKHAFAVKVDKYVFYNYEYTSTDFSEVLLKLSDNKLSQDEFLDLFYSNLSSYYTVIFNGLQFTLFSNTSDDHTVSCLVDGVSKSVTKTKKSYDYELSARFGIISKYSSTVANCSFKISKSGVDTYTLSLGRKSAIKDYEVSFIPGTLNGYGIDIYYDFINALENNSFYLIDLDKNAKIENLDVLFNFGNEIVPKVPSVNDFNNAIDKITLETGVYYDFIATLGYDNAAYLKHLDSISRSKYVQVMCSVPPTILNKEEMILFRNNTTIDNSQFWMAQPFCSDSTIGEFTTLISSATFALERAYANKLGGREFAPLFHKTNGRLNISGYNGSALKVKFDDVADREDLLGSQINCIKYDNRGNVYYLNDSYTMQTVNSDLSDWNNQRMVNVLAHIADRTMDQFIAEFNNAATRANVVSVLTENVNSRMVANQEYSFADINIVCDETNNTMAIIRDRKLVVDIYIQFYNGVKYVLVYQRVLPLQSAA